MDGLSESMFLVSIQWLKIPMDGLSFKAFGINLNVQDRNGMTLQYVESLNNSFLCV